MDLKDLTLIVPTKNEASNIGRFLDAVPGEIRIIIVDASSDNTCDLIRDRNRSPICILQDHGNIATARQLGADHARTEWLLFSDADVVFATDYFDKLQNRLTGERDGGLAGAKLSRDRYRCYYFIFSLWLWLCCRVGLPAASGSNMLVRRRALLEAGGFDRTLSCNEDSELIWRIHRCGYKIHYDGGLKVYEFDHRRLDRGVLRKTAHSLTRCALLFCGLRLKKDWGYWKTASRRKSIRLYPRRG